MNIKLSELRISNDKSLLNREKVCEFLQYSYWANKRPREKILKSIENSLCYGVYYKDIQVGFARIITDWATMYWLCDVYIDEQFRGRGAGKMLIREIVTSPELRNLFGYLGTQDAHLFYEEFGFSQDQEKIMSRIPDFLKKI